MNHQLLEEQFKKLRLMTASGELTAVLSKHKSAAHLDWAIELFEGRAPKLVEIRNIKSSSC